MDIEEFESGASSGTLESYKGYYAFNPNRLPPSIDFGLEIMGALSDAQQSVSELKGVGRTVDNPRMLIRPFMRQEAVLSSRIEGTRAELSDVYAYEAGKEGFIRESHRGDTREVVNYVSATERGLRELSENELDLELIKKLHEILLKNVRGEKKSPGEFRDGRNYIAPRGADIEDSRFVPPPAHMVPYQMENLLEFIQADDDFPPLIKLGLIHYQFETIHPFWDGNGRIGRLIITLLLCKWGLLNEPFLYTSAFFNRHRRSYVNHLYNVSANNEWKEWLKFFLNAIETQADEAYVRSKELMDLKNEYRELYQDKTSRTHLQLIDHLFEKPFITVNEAKEVLNVSYQAANNTVSTMVDDGILVETTGKKRNRRFEAIEIYDILSQPLENLNVGSKQSIDSRQASIEEYL